MKWLKLQIQHWESLSNTQKLSHLETLVALVEMIPGIGGEVKGFIEAAKAEVAAIEAAIS